MNALWALTSYFNPCGWKSRARNYHAFRRHLAAPLLTVEWHPDGRFELGPGDADLLVQVRGGDPMWQKERLLNLGLRHLPPEARHVACVDADVVFSDANWADRTVEALEHCEVLQPFAQAHYLDPVDTARLAAGGVAPGAAKRAAGVVSVARLAAEVGPRAVAEADLRGLEDAALPGNGMALPRSPGLAWAARRSVLEDLGLYDRAVIGSGDLLWTMGVLGVGGRWLDGASSRGFSYLARSSYRAWAERAAQRVGGRVGHLETTVLHLHGGDLADRRYKARHRAFGALGLDVDRDLRLDPGGAWAWVESQPRWTRFIEAYFRGREEDRGFVP